MLNGRFDQDSLTGSDLSECGHGRQFLLIRRDFVEAHWRSLYLTDKGASTHLLLVLLSLCWGYGERGAYARLNFIRQLTSLDNALLARARNRLNRRRFVLKLSSPHRGIWKFADGGQVLAAANEHGRFLFPIRFLYGRWSFLSGEECAVLVALACIARPTWDEREILNDEWIAGDGVRDPFVRNSGELDYNQLALLTGISEGRCEDTAKILCRLGLVNTDGSNFCLPDEYWYLGDAAQRESHLLRSVIARK